MKFAGDKKDGRSLLADAEEHLKNWMLPKVPKSVETYHLTLTTVLWCLLLIVFGFLSRHNVHWLWLSSLVIFLQYITDLLDGAIGRTRNTGLIKWGFYMDHFLDYMFLCSILIGYSFRLTGNQKLLLLFILMLFGAFMVNSFLSFAATNKFRISYMGIGPTEMRIIFILINSLLIFVACTRDASDPSQPSYLARSLPYILWASTFVLFVTVFKTQKSLWLLDMDNKNKEADDKE